MRKVYFVGLALFIALVIGAVITSGGTIGSVLNIPSFLLVAGCTFVLLLMNFRLREMGICFAVGFMKKDATPEDLKKGYIFFRSMQLYLLLSGLMGTIIGAMAMLVNLKDHNAIGWGAALAILTILYGLIFSMGITIPFMTGIKRRLIEIGEEIPQNR